MKRIVLLCVSIITYTAGENINYSCECGVGGENRRIVGGSAVQPHQYPWLVSLMLGQKLHCGGAIITDLHVLTAGHCITFGNCAEAASVHAALVCLVLIVGSQVSGKNLLSGRTLGESDWGVTTALPDIRSPSIQENIMNDYVLTAAAHCVHYRDLTVNVGMHDRLQSSYFTYRVVNGEKHPDFTSNAVRDINDIAVLTLDRRLKFTDKVQPICLPTEDMDFIEVPLTVAGWGKTRQGALTSSRYLQETKVKIVNSDECTRSSVYRDNLVPDGMMCAYNLGKDACQGDSGGPLFSTHSKTQNTKWYQVGIVSWGIDCAMPGYPGVYTIVSKYINWIKQQTKIGTYCK